MMWRRVLRVAQTCMQQHEFPSHSFPNRRLTPRHHQATMQRVRRRNCSSARSTVPRNLIAHSSGYWFLMPDSWSIKFIADYDTWNDQVLLKHYYYHTFNMRGMRLWDTYRCDMVPTVNQCNYSPTWLLRLMRQSIIIFNGDATLQ